MTATPLTSTQGAGRAGDKIFSGAALAAGCLILAVLFGVALFLVVQAIPALTAPAAQIQGGEGFFAYIWPIVIGTLIAAVIALVIATPVAIGVALFISHFAPRGLAAGLGYVVDLLAAIPSVVYGAWGAAFLAKEISPAYNWLAQNMGWLPIFQGPASATGKTILPRASSSRSWCCPSSPHCPGRSSCRRPSFMRKPPSPWAPPAGK